MVPFSTRREGKDDDYLLSFTNNLRNIKRFYYMASSVSGQDESNPALRLATKSGQVGAILPARGNPPCPMGKISLKAIC